jgi:hypothetical protein
MATESLFVADGDAIVATELSRGPWDPRSCHGGPVAALLARACEQHETAVGEGAVLDGTWQLARITVELVRPVPLGEPMRLAVETERPGRSVSLLAVRLTKSDGMEVARARALRIRAADVALPESFELQPPFIAPGSGQPSTPVFGGDDIAFHRNGIELLFAEGDWDTPGAVGLWGRLRVPLLPGETPTGVQRTVATADFSNGVSSELDPADMTFINPDLSVHLLRPPVGEWIGMQARSFYGPNGAGIAEGALFDEVGRCGRSAQSLILSTR